MSKKNIKKLAIYICVILFVAYIIKPFINKFYFELFNIKIVFKLHCFVLRLTSLSAAEKDILMVYFCSQLFIFLL